MLKLSSKLISLALFFSLLIPQVGFMAPSDEALNLQATSFCACLFTHVPNDGANEYICEEFRNEKDCQKKCVDEAKKSENTEKPLQLTEAVFADSISSSEAIRAQKKCEEHRKKATEAIDKLVSKRPLATPVLSVDIPTVSFSQALVKGDYLSSNFLAEYITGVYQYLIGASLLIAVVLIMIGGLQYAVSGGRSDLAQKGKDRMKNAVIGTVLLLSVYIILYTTNPRLTVFQALNVPIVDPIAYVFNSGEADEPIVISGDRQAQIQARMDAAGIACPGGGDVAEIAAQFAGKTNYRLGGKGQEPPYFECRSKKKDLEGRPFCEYCPKGTICLDCSGFVALVSECAGLSHNIKGKNTSGIFAGAPKVTDCGEESISLANESIALKPGDLIGFTSADRKADGNTSPGHVWMYVGGGQLINSQGSGRTSGKAVATQRLEDVCKRYETLRYKGQ